MNIPTSKGGFFSESNDGQCIQKLKEGELIYETYLDLVDDLRSDEECCFLDQMSISGEDIGVVELQPVTLVPPSTYQARENQMVKQMNEICRTRKGWEVKIIEKEILPEPNTQESGQW